MSETLGGMIGLGGGQSGTGIDGPALANLIQPVSAGQLATADAGTQNSLQSQQALLQALQGQNGIGNQSQVYNQMQGVANGTGPNPAAAMLNQATGANTANQAALMAGQRGAGANPALIARQAAMQGAANQQNAAGQAASMQANQSLNALNAAGNIAGQQVSNQMGATNSNTSANLQNQSNLLGAMGQFNNALISNQSSVNSANAGLAGIGMQGQQKAIGGLMNGLGASGLMGGGIQNAAGGVAAAHGGMIPEVPNGPLSGIGKHLNLKGGGFVPGKAPVAGDSPKNDIVDAKLSPGEVVIPRSVMNSKNPSAAAAKFVEAVLAKKGKKK